ncbi:phage holin family protein [Virgibacillus sp. W0430]|uniref:phage holin family protein n=1 Tax=Virgibacillus sp. W0430 TaxID=3391580 RepID=UPI003F44BD90
MILRWLLSIFLNAVALIAVAQLFDAFHIADFTTALLASFLLSILNIIVKPLLIIFTLPITVITFGLFLFIINAITLYFTQSLMSHSFVIDGFGMTIIASIIISIINTILNQLIKDIRKG